MSKLIRVSIWVALILCLVLPIKTAQAIITNSMVTLDLLGPTTAVRGNGSPFKEAFHFVSDFGGPATLKVMNGGLPDSSGTRVSSAVIKLNSQVIFGPSEFNNNVYQIEKDILLTKGDNSLEVELRGKPGGKLTFQLVQSVSNVHVIPTDIVFDEPGTPSQITVLGNLTDGTEVNITGSSCGTTYLSSDTHIAIVTNQGLASGVAPGNAVITIANDFFTATVDAVVNGSRPSLSNISLYPTALPVPREGDQFVLQLAFEYQDANADIERIDITFIYPDGKTKIRSEQFFEPVAEGAHLESFLVDDSFVAGAYQLEIEVFDGQGNSSGAGTAVFNLSETAEPILEISSITPSQGAPGDVIVIEGRGFATADPSENKIQFMRLSRADILSVTADRMEVVVPVGALTGPIVLATSAGRTQSSMVFSVNPTMAILPAVNRLLTGQTVTFTIAQSGLRSESITCSINDQIQPYPALGILDPIDSRFIYTSPQEVPSVNPVLLRCIAENAPGVYAEMEIEIVAPVPPPGSALIEASRGGTIESVQGDASISIPPGALFADTAITVEQLDPDDLLLIADDAYTLGMIRLEPSGIHFLSPVTISLPLRNWVEPGTEIPLYLLDEVAGLFDDIGRTGTVDDSGLRAIASIDHFSTYAVRQPYSAVQILKRQSLKDLVQDDPLIFSEYQIITPPDMPFIEGLSVPVLVKRRIAPPPGMGPFAEPSLLHVSVEVEGYPVAIPPANKGPFVQPSPDGWELGTVINIGTLPDCDEGNTKAATLKIKYKNDGLPQNLSIPFTIQCLDELAFSGAQPPGFVPEELLPIAHRAYYDHKGLRVRTDENGKYVVELIYPSQIYRFSQVDIGSEGVLTYTKRLPPTWVTGPFIMEITGNVAVWGGISLAGQPGAYGFDGGEDPACGDCGGVGGRGGFLNAGAGGHGGEFSRSCDAECCALYQRLFGFCPDNVTQTNGQNGQGAQNSPYGGGQGGYAWEKEDILDLAIDIPSFIGNAVACVPSGGSACLAAAYDIYQMYGDIVGILENDDNYVKSAGEGGSGGGENAPLDIAFFNPPQAGSGGGGAGLCIGRTDDDGGGGGGAGGGAAANLKLIVGGNVTIHEGGFIDGRGTNGGQGGSGEDDEAAPGGGGGGGSGAAVHIAALKGVVNNNLIFAPGGRGGYSGVITQDFDNGVTAALVDSAFGYNGYDGRLRVDGSFEGSEPLAMPLYHGPRFADRFNVSESSLAYVSLDFYPGDKARSYQYVPNTFASGGLQTVTATVENRYSLNGRWYEHTLELHPWQGAFVFYFPGMRDADGDGLSDGMEAAYGSDPTKADTDGDGLSDGDELFVHKTDFASTDTDGDGTEDGAELSAGSDPLSAESTPEACDGIDNDLDLFVDEGFVDTDSDGVADCVDPDDDNDGLSDSQEATLKTNPLDPDTDGDFFFDSFEVAAGTDPLDPNSTPDAFALDLPESEEAALFGFRVTNAGDIDGRGKDDFLISAPLKDVDGYADVGRVYLFAGEDGSLVRNFDHPNPDHLSAGGQFGYALAGINDVNHDGVPDVLISAPFVDNAYITDSGRVFLFSGKDGTVIYEFSSPVSGTGYHFGMSVAATGGEFWKRRESLCGGLKIIVGEPHNGHGRAYVFSPEGALVKTLSSPDPDEYTIDEFGWAVSVEGSFEDFGEGQLACIVRYRVGAPGRSGEEMLGEGRSYLFTQLGSTTNVEIDPTTSLGEQARFGSALAHVDSWVTGARETASAIGAPGDANGRGTVFFMPDAYNQFVLDIGPSPFVEFGAEFGSSMAIVPWYLGFNIERPNTSQAMLAVGAPGQDVGIHFYQTSDKDEGMVFLFMGMPPRWYTNPWGVAVSAGYLTSPQRQNNAAFGHSMALSGSYLDQAMLAVSAPWEDVNGLVDQGRVYLFNLSQIEPDDADGDGLIDTLEEAYGCDPDNWDSDGDGLSDGDEVFVHKTHPASADTDDDGFGDGIEIGSGSDPLNAASTPEVCDGSDNDLDGLVDEGFPDTDQDSLSDCIDPDDDNDGLSDDQEVALNTNPLDSDTDGDGIPDGDELTAGSDPLDATSTPEVCDGIDNNKDGRVDEDCFIGVVSGGGFHTLSIKANGTLWAWGENNYGRLGDGTMTWSSIPVPSNSGNDWALVSAGYFHSLGLKTDGTLWSWGYNYQCQLGLGGDCPGTDRYIPTQIGTDDDWVMISAGQIHSFGLKSDGTLWAWGDNYWHQLGDGLLYREQHSSPIQIGDNQWVMVSGMSSHTLGLKRNGTLWAWGTTVSESGLGDGVTTGSVWPMRIGEESDWSTVSAGNQYSLALKSDGTLWAWGWNGFGQLGDGTTEPSKVPIQIGVDDDWIMVSTGTYHNLALKADGTLWSWGRNYYGQLGNGTTTDEYVPVQIGTDDNWVMVSAGDFHSLALKSDGTLWVWGSNYQGQLGDGAHTDRTVPYKIDW